MPSGVLGGALLADRRRHPEVSQDVEQFVGAQPALAAQHLGCLAAAPADRAAEVALRDAARFDLAPDPVEDFHRKPLPSVPPPMMMLPFRQHVKPIRAT